MHLHELLSKSRTEIENHSRQFAKGFQMNNRLCTRMLGGPIMYCDPDNNDFTPWMGLEGFWEMWITMCIGRAVQPGWICYDVGAAWGYYSLLFGMAGASHIVAVEPIHDRVGFIQLNMATNFYGTKFDLVEKALNDGKEEQTIVKVIPNMACGYPQSLERTFASTTFDKICLEKTKGKVDFIKVDIDGGELKFWDGIQETIKANPAVIICMEVNAWRYDDAKKFYDSLQSVFPTLRLVTTDGTLRTVSVAELIELSLKGDQMVWLQD